MKTMIGLVVMVALVAGVVGCDSTPSELDYKDVRVRVMTLSIPDDWERPDEYVSLVNDFYAAFTVEERQAIEIDAYGDVAKENAFLMPATFDMVALSESSDTVWPGWDITLETIGVSAGEFAEILQWNVVAGFTDLTRETHQQLTIGGYEAWETMYTGKSEGESVQICVLIVFPPDDIGVLVMAVKKGKWSKYEDIWETIRDSVEFHY